MDSDSSERNSTRSESPREELLGATSNMAQVSCRGESTGHEELELNDREDGASGSAVKDIENTPSTSNGTNSGLSGIDRLLQQQKNEIMFELRRMKLGDRPVTGQGHKEAVESFFDRVLQDNSDQPPAPSEQHRPEAVTVEVNALVDRRPVSSLLQSARFRTNLESALRGALANLSPISQRSSVAQSRSSSASVRSRAQPAAQVSNENTVPSPPPIPGHITPATPPLPGHITPATPTQPDTQQSQPTLWAQIRTQPQLRPNSALGELDLPQPTTHTQQPVQQAAPAPSQPRAPSIAQQWLNQQVELPDHASNDVEAEYMLEQAQREDFIADISELVQRQLVTSSLAGNFRNTLEHLMDGRLRAMQTDRTRVQQFIQNLPHTGVVRNDFSNLGINVAQPNGSDILDDISVISATAAVTVPNVQSQAVGREMASVKAQLQELRSMMRLSFDLQLDIQRAIRQEVAAAISSALADAPPQASARSTAEASRTSRPINESQCLICIDSNVDSVLYQCGHMCVCYKCGLDLRSRNSHCPVCRAPIKDIIRAYRSNDD